MRNLAGLAGLTTGALFLSSCVTYPYESAFSSCERQANDCYRICEDIPDERGYVNCQNYCDRDIDRCFDSAYSSYQSSYYGYGSSSYGYGYSPSPWYGRYGTWYPSYGYALSFSTYDRYGYRKRRHNPPRYDGRPPRDRYYGQPGSGQGRDPNYRQPGSRPPRGGQTQQSYPQPYPQTGGQQGGPAPGSPPVATPPPSSGDYRRGRRPPSPRDGDGGRIAPTEDPPEDRLQGRGGRMMDGTPSAREYRGSPQPQYTPPPQPAPAPSYDPPRQSDPAPSYSPPQQQSAPQPDYAPAPSYSEPPMQGGTPPERPSGPSSPRESEGNGETY